MSLLSRIAGAVVLMLVAAFCGYGFLATFERAPDYMAWRIGYGVVGLTCLAAAGWLLRPAAGTDRR